MNRLFLVLVVAGQRVALEASRVESVVELDELTPVPGVAPHIAGLAALRSRVLTAIDPHVLLGSARAPDGVREAVVIDVDGHPYAMLVDSVHDVVEASGEPLPLRTALHPDWSRLSAGLVDVDGEVMIRLDVDAVLAGSGNGATVSALSTIAA